MCMNCSHGDCNKSFHVTCALLCGLWVDPHHGTAACPAHSQEGREVSTSLSLHFPLPWGLVGLGSRSWRATSADYVPLVCALPPLVHSLCRGHECSGFKREIWPLSGPKGGSRLSGVLSRAPSAAMVDDCTALS